jgi:Cu2+-exporting ATPase
MDHMTHQKVDRHAGHKISDAHTSHDRHAGHSVAMFRDKFWLSFFLTIPVVFWSTDVQHWFGYRAASLPGSRLIAPILGTVVFVYGGLVFFRGAWGELADHKPGMMTLISLAITVACGTSLAATFGLFEIDIWWELSSLITIMLLGHWLEMRAISTRSLRFLIDAQKYRRVDRKLYIRTFSEKSIVYLHGSAEVTEANGCGC